MIFVVLSGCGNAPSPYHFQVHGHRAVLSAEFVGNLVIGFVNILSFALGREELSAPLLGLLLGSSLLLAALRSRSRFSSLTHNFGLTFLTEVFQVDALYLFSSLKYVFGLLTVLGSVAALALDFGGVSIWITIVGLGNLVICWLTVLHMLFVGRRMLHLAVSRSSSESRR